MKRVACLLLICLAGCSSDDIRSTRHNSHWIGYQMGLSYNEATSVYEDTAHKFAFSVGDTVLFKFKPEVKGVIIDRGIPDNTCGSKEDLYLVKYWVDGSLNQNAGTKLDKCTQYDIELDKREAENGSGN